MAICGKGTRIPLKKGWKTKLPKLWGNNVGFGEVVREKGNELK